MSTTTIVGAMIVMLGVSAVVFLGHLAVVEVNPATSVLSNVKSNSLLNSYGDGTNLTTNVFNTSELPEASQSVDADTGNIFTDLFNTAKSWIVESTGARYVVDFISAPYSLLKNTGLSPPIAFVLGSAWYGIMIFLIISWIFNR